MSPGKMLPGQMLLWQLESVLDFPMNLYLKFGKNGSVTVAIFNGDCSCSCCDRGTTKSTSSLKTEV